MKYSFKPKLQADPDGGWGAGGLDPPLKNHKNLGFLSNTGPDHLKITKLPNSVLLAGPMMARLKWYLDPPSPHQLKKCCQICTTSDKIPGSEHENTTWHNWKLVDKDINF